MRELLVAHGKLRLGVGSYAVHWAVFTYLLLSCHHLTMWR
jgi:hypothetical protein